MHKQIHYFILTTVFFSFLLKAQVPVGYNYVIPITVTNPNNVALIDYQVSLDINTMQLISNSKMDFNAKDVLFQHGCKNLCFWIEDSSLNAPRTTFWVKVDQLNPGVNTVYMYYGNNTITNNTYFDGNCVFEFFDDFNAGTLDNSKWNTNDYVAYNGGENFFVTPTTTTSGQFTFTASSGKKRSGISHPMAMANYELGTKYKIAAHPYGTSIPDSDVEFGWLETPIRSTLLSSSTTTVNASGRLYAYGVDDEDILESVASTGVASQLINNAMYADVRGNYHYVRLRTVNGKGTGKRFTYQPFNTTNLTTSISTVGLMNHASNSGSEAIYLGSADYENLQMYFDFVFVKKAAPLEPNLIVGSEVANNLPCAISLSSNSPVCEGQQLTISAVNNCAVTPSSTMYITTPTNSKQLQATTQYQVSVALSSDSGNYYFTDTIQGCAYNDSIFVAVHKKPFVQTTDYTICVGTSASIQASGASNYSWNNSTIGNINTVSPLQTTSYVVTGTNQFNCSDTAEAVVTVNPLPVVTVNSPEICIGEQATLNATGAVSYSWSNMAQTQSIQVSPVTTTAYAVIGTNQYNCSTSVIASVVVNSTPLIAVQTSPTCVGQLCSLAATGAATYNWSNGISGAQQAFPLYISTQIKVVGTDANGCIDSTTVILNPNPLPTANFSLTVQDSLCSYAALIVNGSLQTATNYWYVNNEPMSNEEEPVITLPSIGNYELKLVVENSYGCKDTTLQTISVKEEFMNTLYVPNTFTPNNDGVNDTWGVEYTCMKEMKCEIFNRWGEHLATLPNLNAVWNGYYDGKLADSDIYVYKLIATSSIEESKIAKVGHILLLR
ncbi:MAG: DUF2341 domain-containing protein [Bacteroidetes bacterium]|nr:DUF2341 domain-containing protein [Bacteroidota bacterium]